MFRKTFDDLPDLEIRLTEKNDGKFLYKWLCEPETVRWFAMHEEKEVEEAAERWILFHQYRCSLTAVFDGVPCGMATLYLQPYRKLSHQCQMGIVVGEGFKNLKVGSKLMESIIELAREHFNIEVLHLEVYGENPAIRLYKRLGFREFGRQTHFIKETGGSYVSRVMMEMYIAKRMS